MRRTPAVYFWPPHVCAHEHVCTNIYSSAPSYKVHLEFQLSTCASSPCLYVRTTVRARVDWKVCAVEPGETAGLTEVQGSESCTNRALGSRALQTGRCGLSSTGTQTPLVLPARGTPGTNMLIRTSHPSFCCHTP